MAACPDAAHRAATAGTSALVMECAIRTATCHHKKWMPIIVVGIIVAVATTAAEGTRYHAVTVPTSIFGTDSATRTAPYPVSFRKVGGTTDISPPG